MQKVSVGDILSAWIAAIGRHAPVCLLAGGLIGITTILSDMIFGETIGGLVGTIPTFFIGYHLVEYVLARDFRTATGQRRYLDLFVSALLTLFGTAFGLILLIIPGFYLAARWSLASPLVIGEDLGAVSAMSESWRRTKGSAGTILVCYLLLGLVFIGGAIAFGAIVALVGGLGADNSFVASLGGNMLGGAIGAIANLMSCALYGLIGKPTGALDDVFS